MKKVLTALLLCSVFSASCSSRLAGLKSFNFSGIRTILHRTPTPSDKDIRAIHTRFATMRADNARLAKHYNLGFTGPQFRPFDAIYSKVGWLVSGKSSFTAGDQYVQEFRRGENRGHQDINARTLRQRAAAR